MVFHHLTGLSTATNPETIIYIYIFIVPLWASKCLQLSTQIIRYDYLRSCSTYDQVDITREKYFNPIFPNWCPLVLFISMLLADAAAATQAILVMGVTAYQHLCEGDCACRHCITGVVSTRTNETSSTSSGHWTALPIPLQIEYVMIRHRYQIAVQ